MAHVFDDEVAMSYSALNLPAERLMAMRKPFLLALCLLIAACSTTVETRLGAPMDETGSALKINSVKVVPGATIVSPSVLAKLEAAVRSKLAERPQGDRAANLQLTVTKYKIVKGGSRFFAGAFAGANKMFVSVKATDLDGQTLADFDVKREANPGGYGAFYDQAEATIDAVAQGVVDALHGTIPKQ